MVYYAILHDADPGPQHIDNVCSREHQPFSLKTALIDGGIRITPDWPLKFIARRSHRSPWFVTLWEGPTHRATICIVSGEHAFVDDEVRVDFEIKVPWSSLPSVDGIPLFDSGGAS